MRLRVGRDGLSPVPRAEVVGVDCVVGAVSKMHKPAADRGRKTDRRDAQFLAVQLAGRGHRGARARCRMRGRAQGFDAGPRRRARRRGRAKQRLSKFLLRHGFVRREELRRPEAQPLDQGFLGVGRASTWGRRRHGDADHYCVRVRGPMPPRPRLRRKSRRWPSSSGEADVRRAQMPRWRRRRHRGLDACEVDSCARFAAASGFAAWVGLVPSEHSSGESHLPAGITKAGNKHRESCSSRPPGTTRGASRSPKGLAKGANSRRGDAQARPTRA